MQEKKQDLSDMQVKIRKRIIATVLIILILIIILASLQCSFGRENYVSDKDFNSIIIKNDIGAEFKIKKEKNYDYKITSYKDTDGEKYIEINVEDNLSITCNRTPIEPNKNYRLSIVMKNHNSNPLFLYSFWKDSITESRNYTLAGENGNPPISETQEIHQDWVTFTEMFKAEEKESFIRISISSNSGVFYFKSISIEEITDNGSS
jgi:uncharacterized protein YxeA